MDMECILGQMTESIFKDMDFKKNTTAVEAGETHSAKQRLPIVVFLEIEAEKFNRLYQFWNHRNFA